MIYVTDQRFPGLTPRAPSATPRPAAPSLFETFGAAFDIENAPLNVIEFMSRPDFEPDPDHNPIDVIGGTMYETDWLNNFVGSRSEKETRFIMGEIDSQLRSRDILARSGISGFIAAMAAGAADPTLFIPVVGWLARGAQLSRAGRTALAAGEAAAATAGAVALQEGALQATQETRTAWESAWNIGGAALIGGLLGGAVGILTRPQISDLAGRMAKTDLSPDADIAAWNRATAAAGAQVTSAERGTGELAGALGAEKIPILARQDPLIRTTTSPVRETRLLAMDIAETPLTRVDSPRGIAASVGGPVESMIREWQWPLTEALQEIDRLYSLYFFGRPKVAARAQANVAKWLGQGGGKLSPEQFDEAIFDAWLAGDVHSIPEVQEAARRTRQAVFDPLRDEAIKARVPGFREGMQPQSGDAGYVPRDYNVSKILAEQPEFRRNVLMPAAKRAQQAARDRAEAWRARMTADIERQIADLELSGDARAATLTDLERQLKTLRERGGQKFAPVDEQLERLRSRLLAERQAGNERAAAATSQQVKDVVQQAGKEYADYVTARNVLSTRLRRIRGNIVGRENQVEAIRARIADTEAANVERLWRMHKAAAKLESELDELAPDAIEAELSSLRTQFAKVMERSNKAQDDLARAKERRAAELQDAIDKGDAERTATLQAEIDRGDPFVMEARRETEMSRLAERIGDLEEFDPAAATTELRMLIERRLAQSAQVVEDAGKYMLALTERMRKANPDIVRERVSVLKARLAAIENKATSRLAEMSDQELEAAMQDIVDNITGASPNRVMLPTDFEVGPRGALKKRVLNFVTTRELRPYLNTSAQSLLHRYVRTLAPDVSFMRKFGSLDMSGELAKINDAYNRMIDATPAGKARDALVKRRAEDYRDLSIMVRRQRGLAGIPTEPQSLAYRGARTVRNLNYLRLLGGMTVSAFPDLANVVAEYGLTRVMGTAFNPMVRGLRGMKLAAKEVRMGGTALDMRLDTRAMSIAEIGDEWAGGTVVERGIQAATRKFGIVSLMAPWNATIKSFVGTIGQTRMLQFAKRLAEGKKLTAKEMAILADNYIDPATARIIAEQFEKHGIRDGEVWIANTIEWDDAAQEAARTFRRGLAREVDKVIVTPGQDKPIWMSGENALLGQLGPVIGQFRSFGFASAQRVFLARLQRRDANAMMGSLLQLGLGALVYYFKSVAGGYEVSDDPKKWATEALDRSGLLAWFVDVNNFSEKATGGVIGLSALTGEYAQRYAGRGVVGSLLGPSFDAAETFFRVAGAPFKESGLTGSDIHALRKLIPLQNLIGLSRGFDAMENATVNAFGLTPRRRDLRTR